MKSSHQLFFIPLTQHFPVPLQTLPKTSCLQKTMSCCSLLCYTGSQGGVLGFLWVWFGFSLLGFFSIAKSSISLNRARDHPHPATEQSGTEHTQTRVPPRGDPNLCPTLPSPRKLPCDEGQRELMLIPSAYSEKQVYT